MGNSASATVLYGIAWEGETSPPAFQGEYGYWDYAAALNAYPAKDWSGEDMDEDSFSEGEWAESLLKTLGVEKYLTVERVGYGEEPGFAVGVERIMQEVGDYGLMDLVLQEPNEAEREAILRVAEALGYRPEQVGLKLYAYYG